MTDIASPVIIAKLKAPRKPRVSKPKIDATPQPLTHPVSTPDPEIATGTETKKAPRKRIVNPKIIVVLSQPTGHEVPDDPPIKDKGKVPRKTKAPKEDALTTTTPKIKPPKAPKPPKPPKPNTTTGPFFVYFLVTTRTRSVYVGATIDLAHRFRQHCCELAGGAKITHRAVDRGETWEINRYVAGFPTWNTALKFEWRWKHLANRGLYKKVRVKKGEIAPPAHVIPKNKVDRYILALRVLLSQDSISAATIPYVQWPTPPTVHVMSDGATLPGPPIAASERLGI